MSCSENPCHGGCGTVQSERIRYFTGRHMVARDFRDEQLYHRSHRYLHNRMLHGWGVVCGFEVRPHRQEECRDRFVEISCGMAIDRCGREIVLHHDVIFGEIPWKERPAAPERKPGEPPDPYEWVLLLRLCFCEKAVELTPVLYSDAACSTPEKEHSSYPSR